jgi:hypothetical protein
LDDLLTTARRFTIAFAGITIAGLVVSVAVPLLLPGPKYLTIALGSCCLILIIVVGARLLRRKLIRRAPPGS